MKVLKFFSNFVKIIYHAIRRFPLSILLSIITTVILIVSYNNSGNFSQRLNETLLRASLTTVFGIFLTLCVNILIQRIKIISHTKQTILYSCCVLLLFLFYKFMLVDFRMEVMSRYFILNLTLLLIFLIIPCFKSQQSFELYIIRILSQFFSTLLYSAIIFIGISAILFTIKNLLFTSLSSKLYYDFFLLITGIFIPCYFLSGIPSLNETLTIEKHYPKLLKLLLLYILMPLLSLYMCILYIYFVKIMISFTLPLQLIIHLVLWFSIISLIAYFLTFILENHYKLVKSFNFWYIKLLIPLVLMMFLAIYKRISSFGLTESRYFVLLIGIWLIFSLLYLNLSKHKNNQVIPLSLSILLIVSVFGPIDAYNASKYSQNLRFKQLLTKNNMLISSHIIPPAKQISEADNNNISSILNYFINYHSLNDVYYLPSNFKITDSKKLLGFELNTNTYVQQNSKFFSYNITDTSAPINTMGYSYLIDLRDYKPERIKIDKNLEMIYNNTTTELTLLNNNQIIYRKFIADYGKLLFKKYGDNNSQLVNSNMVFIDSNSNITIKYILLSVNGHSDKVSSNIKIDYLNFYLLIKKNKGF